MFSLKNQNPGSCLGFDWKPAQPIKPNLGGSSPIGSTNKLRSYMVKMILEVKNIEKQVPAFFKHNIFSTAGVI